MKTGAKRSQSIQIADLSYEVSRRREDPKQPIPPSRADLPLPWARSSDEIRRRMYTEEEVAVIIQVSLSQLRKWRMKGNLSRVDGPPFRKIGRMVRYPADALEAYINGTDDE
jgi:hypothetical protein